MALVVGTNTYISLADAEIYFTNRFGSSAWTALSNTDKEKLLLSATRLLDKYATFEGEKADPDQLLEFPRYGELIVPTDIISAQCEIAVSVASNGGIIANPEPAIKSMKADVVELVWNDKSSSVNYSIFSSYTRDLLRSYCVGNVLVRV